MLTLLALLVSLWKLWTRRRKTGRWLGFWSHLDIWSDDPDALQKSAGMLTYTVAEELVTP